MKTLSISPILAAVAAAFIAGMALVAPMQEAQAGKGRSPRATTTGSKINTGVRDHRRALPKLPSENKWTATGTKANPGPEVRDHRDPTTWPGGVKVPGGTHVVGAPPQGPRPGSRGCARWPNTPSCHPIVRDHRGPRVVPKEDPPQKW